MSLQSDNDRRGEEQEAQGVDAESEQSIPTSFSQSDPPPRVSLLETGATYPWTKWVESLRLRKRGIQPSPYVDGWLDGPSIHSEEIIPSLWDNKPWDQASGGSSSILGTVKTASMSVPPSSAPRSRATTATSSIVLSRQSVESTRSSIYDAMTHASKLMAIRRRHVLREIYSSEENYVYGLRTIVQILSTYITMRPAILRDVERLYGMHDAFKSQLESISPQSAETWTDGIPIRKPAIIRKIQNQSLLARSMKRRIEAEIRKEWADPSEALMVAKEIDKLTEKFDLYEAFIRTFDVLVEDIALLRRNHPADGFWTEGIEALQKSMHSSQRRKEHHKKSMTMDDLIAKPVQRVCKYRLLLSELLKTIPETSYPRVHSEIKNILDRNVQAVERINTVVGDPSLRIRIRKTISLHRRLDYGEQVVLENVYQELGPLILCGVLHVAYHSLTGIAGRYLVCVLFPSYFVLARPGIEPRKLILVASIYLSDMTVDTSMNGQGIACLDTPFSWKVVFQHDQKLYELIFSASSSLEERGWKTEMLRASMMPPNEVPTISLEPRRFSFTSLPLKPLEADGPWLLLKRRGSIKKTSPGSPLQQEQDVVIIKKTHNPLHDNEVRVLHEAELTRSRSVAKHPVCTPTILMTARWHRVKLERNIVGIFSDEILPYPGMTLGGSDYLHGQTVIQKSVMRGLSIRGVFSNSRRSASLGDATSMSTGGHLETQRQTGQEIAAYLGIKEKTGTADTSSESKDIVEDDAHDIKPISPKTAFNSIRRRQRGTRATSDSVADEIGPTKPKSKPRVLWKWASLSILGLFDAANNNMNEERQSCS